MRALRKLVRRALYALPMGRPFDQIFSLAFFLNAHRRWPRRRSGLFTDYLHFAKTGQLLAGDLYRVTADKVEAKAHIADVLGRWMTPETYAVFDSIDEIDRQTLPETCVLKTTHGSGTAVYIAAEDREIDPEGLAALRAELAVNFYHVGRELNYKHLKPRVICEERVAPVEELRDLHAFCHRGKVKILRTGVDRHLGLKLNFYDRAWRPLHLTYNRRATGAWQEPPHYLPEIIAAAEALSAPFEFLRVDFYLTDERFFIGELTHCPNQGLAVFGSHAEERMFSDILFG